MALFHETEFWRHHLGVLLTALLIVGLSRSIGGIGEGRALATILLQSLILVLVALPIQALAAVLAAKYCSICSAWTASLIGCTLAALPSTALSMNFLWIAGLVSDADATRNAFWEWLQINYPAGVILHASLGSLLWMVLSFPWWQSRFLEEQDDLEANAVPVCAVGEDHNGTPGFMKNLSSKAVGQLWALSAERHYVRVTTEIGEELLLMRLSDAVEQCDTMNGMQIHRSHWIHSEGIRRVVRTNGKLVVELKNGTCLPVSRSHQAATARFADEICVSDSS